MILTADGGPQSAQKEAKMTKFKIQMSKEIPISNVKYRPVPIYLTNFFIRISTFIRLKAADKFWYWDFGFCHFTFR
jgi:hypothetical protein